MLYIRYDKALSFEDCSIVQRKLLTNSKLIFEIPRHVKRIKSMKDMSKYNNMLSNHNQDIYRQKKIEMEKSRNGRKKSAPIN